MESNMQNSNSLNVLLIGNNPIELGSVLDKLKQVRTQKIVTEIAFDLRTILERLIRFNPNFIFIDDNIGRTELQETLKQLSSNRKTKDIPITVLKSSNYQEAFGASSILDYLLKQNYIIQLKILCVFAKPKSIFKRSTRKEKLNCCKRSDDSDLILK